jgi:hypothetical protein
MFMWGKKLQTSTPHAEARSSLDGRKWPGEDEPGPHPMGMKKPATMGGLQVKRDPGIEPRSTVA